MEILLKEQANAMSAMQSFIDSYPKYGPSRRTIQFYEKKIEQLEIWKQQFDNRNSKLRPYETMSDQPYFVDHSYERTVELYVNHISKVRDDFNKLLVLGGNDNEQLNQSISIQGAEKLNQSLINENNHNSSQTSDSDDTESEDEPTNDPQMKTLEIRQIEVKSLIKNN